jgi:thiol-disulfide isomerase/thioredoxin
MKSILRLSNAALFTLLFATVVLIGYSTAAFAQSQTAGKSPEQHLRELFLLGDFLVAGRDGAVLAAKPGASLETRAWYIGQGRSLTPLDGMQKEAPQSAWTLAARTFSNTDTGYAIALCEQAIAKNTKEDILILCTAGASSNSWRSPEGPELMLSFLERHKQSFEASPNGIMAKARTLAVVYRDRDKKRCTDEVTALYNHALEMDPKNPAAVNGKFNDLIIRRLYREAAKFITPHVASINSQILHLKYWDVVSKLDDLSKEERARLIDADVRELMARQELVNPYIESVGLTLRGLSEERADALLNFTIQQYPGSSAFETAMFLLAAAKLGTGLSVESATPAIRREVAAKVIEFLKRPNRRNEAAESRALYVLDAYLALDKDADREQMFAVAKSGISQDSFSSITAVAERKLHLAELEALAARRVESMVHKAKEQGLVKQYDASPDYDAVFLWGNVARWYDALGFVHLQQGRINEAEAKLLTAEKLADMKFGAAPFDNYIKRFPDILLHLGRLYTVKGDYIKAEQYLGRSIVAYFPYSTEHPAIAAYRDLYLQQHQKNTAGLNKYMAGIYEKDVVRRKDLILRERIADPAPIPAFKLASLDGKTYSSDDLKGKFVVINFWGAWCGPCVKEMPELQKFYEKYKDHPDVVVLTIDSKDTLEQVKQFIALKKYTMPVLLEGEYFNEAGIGVYPTTWFLDRAGKKVFQTGSSTSLFEEFSWRIESMLELDQAANKSALPKQE